MYGSNEYHGLMFKLSSFHTGKSSFLSIREGAENTWVTLVGNLKKIPPLTNLVPPTVPPFEKKRKKEEKGRKRKRKREKEKRERKRKERKREREKELMRRDIKKKLE